MSNTRLYVVTNTETDQESLIEAGNPAVARSHVARKLLTVHVAKATEAARMVKEGIHVEVAGQDPVE